MVGYTVAPPSLSELPVTAMAALRQFGWPKPCRSAPPRSDVAKRVPSGPAALSCGRDFGAARAAAGTAGDIRTPR